MSLKKEGLAWLDLPIDEIVKGSILNLEITCKDSVMQDYHAVIEYDFTKMTDSKITIAYQYDNPYYMLRALRSMSTSIRGIATKLGVRFD